MSRVGKKPIAVPKGVTVSIGEGEVAVKGPGGSLSQAIHHDMDVSLDDDTITVTRPTNGRLHRSLHGLTRSLIANMVEGVTDGFSRRLQLVGTGYRAQMAGTKLVLAVGFSHPVEMIPPEGVTIEVPTPTSIVVRGADKQQVGEMAAQIRRVRPVEPYLGKGIRYEGERVRRKEGKTG